MSEPQNQNQDQPPKQPQKQPRPNQRQNLVWAILIVLLSMWFVWQMMGGAGTAQEKEDELITSEFTAAVHDGRVTEATYRAGQNAVTGKYYPAKTAGSSIVEAFDEAFEALNTGMGSARTTNETIFGQRISTGKLDETNLGEERKFRTTWVGQDSLGELMAEHPNIKYEVQLPNSTLEAVLSYLPMLILIGFFIFIFYQMSKANNQQMSFGKTKAKMATEERPDVKFADVAGVDEAVEEMTEVKDFVANPQKYQEIGAKIPRGCLLVGPPGTGKTLLARAVAGEAGVPFFSISGSDFVEMFVGVGASRVRDLFKQAKDAAPSIIFIDEIDAVGRQRGAGLGGGHDEREQTLNQLLVEMDGFESNDAVVLIAATNRSDILDPALLRPGRFDRQIVVDVPDVKGREKILQVHAANKPLAQDVDLAAIAKLTPGFTGADLANLLNESALLTARRGKKVISMQEVTESMERVIAGPERKGRVINDKTKKTIAYHESGHALVGHTLPLADPVSKISIVSRGRALGYTLSIPEEDKVLSGREEMLQELAVFLGGRVAEEIFCDDITTGASNDLERATKMARQMVTNYGMSTELGTQVFGEPNHEVFLGRDYGNTQDYSEETARRIDAEVARIMKQAHDTAYDILSARRSQMDLMASVLLERETIDGDACQALLNDTWDEYLAWEQSEEGQRALAEAASTVANQPEKAPAEEEVKQMPGQPGAPQMPIQERPSTRHRGGQPIPPSVNSDDTGDTQPIGRHVAPSRQGGQKPHQQSGSSSQPQSRQRKQQPRSQAPLQGQAPQVPQVPQQPRPPQDGVPQQPQPPRPPQPPQDEATQEQQRPAQARTSHVRPQRPAQGTPAHPTRLAQPSTQQRAPQAPSVPQRSAQQGQGQAAQAAQQPQGQQRAAQQPKPQAAYQAQAPGNEEQPTQPNPPVKFSPRAQAHMGSASTMPPNKKDTDINDDSGSADSKKED